MANYVINSVDTGHEDMIHDAQMNYYGTRLATCSSDRSVKIFEIKGNVQSLIANLQEHDGPVWQIAWAHPMYGNVLASCSYDRKVIIWKEINGQWKNVYEHTNHDSSVNSVCWSPYEFGLILACGSSDGAVSIITSASDGTWETQKINNAHTIGCNAVSWAPSTIGISSLDGSTPAKPVKKLVTGGCDNLVKIWKEDESGQWIEEQKLEAHSDWVRDVAWAPSVGLSRNIIASCSQDRHVIIWTNDGQSSGQWTSKILGTFEDVIWHVSFSVTGNVLAVSGGDNKVSLWKESLEGQWICLSDSNKNQQQTTSERTL